MNIITISREFGSGGRELGKRMADRLGYDYYDREIVTAIAQHRGLDENYVEHTLEKGGWQAMPLTYGRSFAGVNQMQQIQTDLLVAQKHVIEEIAKIGRDCVIVGQNADVLLKAQRPFSMFVCAGTEAKILRCRDRAKKGEELSDNVCKYDLPGYFYRILHRCGAGGQLPLRGKKPWRTERAAEKELRAHRNFRGDHVCPGGASGRDAGRDLRGIRRGAYGADEEGIYDLLCVVPFLGDRHLWIVLLHGIERRTYLSSDLIFEEPAVPGGCRADFAHDFWD